jgi:hypothetical protein
MEPIVVEMNSYVTSHSVVERQSQESQARIAVSRVELILGYRADTNTCIMMLNEAWLTSGKQSVRTPTGELLFPLMSWIYSVSLDEF